LSGSVDHMGFHFLTRKLNSTGNGKSSLALQQLHTMHYFHFVSSLLVCFFRGYLVDFPCGSTTTSTYSSTKKGLYFPAYLKIDLHSFQKVYFVQQTRGAKTYPTKH
jgi:hypothetical protein